MPPKVNLIGKRFGKLVVKKEMPERKNGAVVWECKCDCGNICYPVTADLNRGVVKSCGCYNSESHKHKNEMVGKKFGKLTVIEDSGKRGKSRGVIWKCRCDCGNIKYAFTHSLRSGITSSCGCETKNKYKKRKSYFKDVTGKKFGRLTAIKRVKLKNKKGVYWLCECSCEKHTKIIVNARYLFNGHRTSCGCINSKGEIKISEILKENNIPFETQKTFPSCIFPDTKYRAVFDFWVNNEYLIEYDGVQHFRPWGFNGKEPNKKRFEKTKEHDLIKNIWAQQNKIPIIRIPYTYYKKIKLEDLVPETSKFVIGENDMLYFDIPKYCPSCGQKLTEKSGLSGIALYCNNPNCPAKNLARFVQFVSRQGMNIEGLSEATLEKLIDEGYVKTFEDIYRLDRYKDEIIGLEGFGEKSWDKLWKGIQKSRDCKLENFLVALSIPLIGKTAARTISKHFKGNYQDLINAGALGFDFTQLEDFGEKMNESMHNWLMDYDRIKSLEGSNLAQLLYFEEEKPSEAVDESNFCFGKTFVVTGKFSQPRSYYEELITSRGGKLAGSVSKKTDYLLTDDPNSGSSKAVKARELGIPVLSEAEFMTKVGE